MKQSIMPERSSRKDEKQRHWHQSVKGYKANNSETHYQQMEKTWDVVTKITLLVISG